MFLRHLYPVCTEAYMNLRKWGRIPILPATCASLHLGARGDDDLRPLRRLGGDDLAEVLRRARDRLASELSEARLHLGIGERPVRLGIDLLDDLCRRAPGHADAEPRGGLVARNGLCDGRHARQGRLALCGGDRERANAPALEMRRR